MAATPPTAPRVAALDHDVFCLKCAYNLRGLSGDPVRCPECGNLNPRGDAEIPAAMIAARLRKMETAPCLCVAALLVAVPALGVFGVVLHELIVEWSRYGYTGGSSVALVVLVGVLAVAGWFACAVAFRRSCKAKAGWLGLLALYHAIGITAAAVLLGMPFVLEHFRLRRPDSSESAWLATSVVIALVLLAYGVYRLHRSLCARMQILQREVAIDLIREEARRWAAKPDIQSTGSI